MTGTEAISITQTYVYGGLGGRISDVTTVADSNVFTQGYTWSDLGHIANMDYPDLTGFTEPAEAISTLTYGHTNGFLTSVTGYAPGISYHPNGALDTIVRTNGGSDIFAVDPDSIPRPLWIRAKKGGATLWYTGLYKFDGAGNVTDIGDDTFVYDGLSRLKVGTAEAGTKSQSYTLDSFGNLGSITDSQGTRTITVDAATNRLSSPATYDAAGNLTSWGGYSYGWTPTNRCQVRSSVVMVL